MARYHVNNDGEVRVCKAEKEPCEFSANLHGDTKEEAARHYEEQMRSKEFNTSSKQSTENLQTSNGSTLFDDGDFLLTPEKEQEKTPAQSIETATDSEEIMKVLRNNRQPKNAVELYDAVVANEHSNDEVLMMSVSNAIAAGSVRASDYEKADLVRPAYNHHNLSDASKKYLASRYPTLQTGKTYDEVKAEAPKKVAHLFENDKERFDKIFDFQPARSRTRSDEFVLTRPRELVKEQLDVPGAVEKAFRKKNPRYDNDTNLISYVGGRLRVSSRSI